MARRCAQLILKKMMYPILVLVTTVSFTICSGQSADSVKIKRRLDRQAQAKHSMDSLSEIFYATPSFYTISFELNHKKIPIPDNSKFYATNGQTDFKSRKIGQNKFEFDDLPDSVKFVFEFDKIKVATGFEKKKFFKDGAELRFGYFNHVLELKKQWDKGKKDEDFDEWTDIGQPYLDIIKNEEIIKAAKKGKIRPIEFVTFSPRVYGDGVTHTFQNVRLK